MNAIDVLISEHILIKKKNMIKKYMEANFFKHCNIDTGNYMLCVKPDTHCKLSVSMLNPCRLSHDMHATGFPISQEL